MIAHSKQEGSPEISYPLTIESRFGDITIRENDVVLLPEGIYGFEEYKTYALVKLPGQTLTSFHVLQCLDEVGLAFLLTPLMVEGKSLIPEGDLIEATDYLDLKFRSCDFYAITTAVEKGDKLELTLNLKAPIVVDRNHKRAWQHILEKSDYPIRQIISA